MDKEPKIIGIDLASGPDQSVIVVPYWHPWSDEKWQENYPSCRIVRAELMPKTVI